ncbi:MAG TPA: flagellar basal body P-ring protein FlgI [Desulfobacterales bacterium]|jgi:flagellar P-ring protein FlgI|nr:flagellar basal body P-ring protein FlgI [Desulfobacterales bacterium]
MSEMTQNQPTYRRQRQASPMRALLAGVILLLTLVAGPPATAEAARIKDIAAVKGVRPNQLVGYGLVVGLNGSGDNNKTEFTIQSLVNMLERMNVHVDPNDVKVKNVAAVIVTASLPPFARIGNKIDVLVSSIGDAKSLVGGTLLLTPLRGVDREVYALAQGAVSVGGFGATGTTGSSVTQNHLLAAQIPGGATVEKEIPFALAGRQELTLTLFQPDFTTAVRVSDAINQAMGGALASTLDSGTLEVQVPAGFHDNLPGFLARIETLSVTPDSVARIVVNEKTGTVVMGENVRISTVAVAHGNLSISIQEAFDVSQPEPLAQGDTVVTPRTEIQIREQDQELMIVPGGSTIGELVRALNAIGVTPRDLISIFQSIKAAGALQAELEIL